MQPLELGEHVRAVLLDPGAQRDQPRPRSLVLAGSHLEVAPEIRLERDLEDFAAQGEVLEEWGCAMQGCERARDGAINLGRSRRVRLALEKGEERERYPL